MNDVFMTLPRFQCSDNVEESAWRLSQLTMCLTLSCFQTKPHENVFQFRADFLEWFSVQRENGKWHDRLNKPKDGVTVRRPMHEDALKQQPANQSKSTPSCVRLRIPRMLMTVKTLMSFLEAPRWFHVPTRNLVCIRSLCLLLQRIQSLWNNLFNKFVCLFAQSQLLVIGCSWNSQMSAWEFWIPSEFYVADNGFSAAVPCWSLLPIWWILFRTKRQCASMQMEKSYWLLPFYVFCCLPFFMHWLVACLLLQHALKLALKRAKPNSRATNN